MNEGGSRDRASLSEEALWRGPHEGAPSLGTMEDMLRKAPDTVVCLQRGPFSTEGIVESGWGLIEWGL